MFISEALLLWLLLKPMQYTSEWWIMRLKCISYTFLCILLNRSTLGRSPNSSFWYWMSQLPLSVKYNHVFSIIDKHNQASCSINLQHACIPDNEYMPAPLQYCPFQRMVRSVEALWNPKFPLSIQPPQARTKMVFKSVLAPSSTVSKNLYAL